MGGGTAEEASRFENLGVSHCQKRKRTIGVVKLLSVRERPLRHSHHHGRKKVISLLLFINLTSDCNV
jgi:hypothetical protein